MKWRTRDRLDPEDHWTGLSEAELYDLGGYNAERSRGLVHTPEWQAKMAALQERFNAAENERAERWRREGRVR